MTKDDIIEMAIVAQLIDHRDTAESLPADFAQSLNEFAHLVRTAALEEAASMFEGDINYAGIRAAIRALKDKP